MVAPLLRYNERHRRADQALLYPDEVAEWCGAATAAFGCRGNRVEDCEDKDYQIILPTLPTGRVVFNTVFLHGDVRARPFRIEDFRDALAETGTLPDVVALGAYHINHVWAVTLRSTEAVKKLLAFNELQVKRRRCLIIDPEDQQVKLRLHWMLHGVADDDIRTALAAFGKVTDVTRERWRIQGVSDKSSTTRTGLLKLKPGLKVDDLPHQVRVAGELALVVAPGRPMQCLRCHGTGHVRRECKVPRCTKCRRYGHADADCVRTYAVATGAVSKDDSAELLMDVAEAEESAKGIGEPEKHAGATDSSGPSSSDGGRKPEGAESSTNGMEASSDEISAPALQETDSAVQETEPATPSENHDKSGARSTSGPAPAKRPHAQTGTDGDKAAAPSVEEPPAKTTQGRRPSIRPRPNVSTKKRTLDKPPPQPGLEPAPDGSGVKDVV
ncbi:uncharacterized protein LOC144124077 [Amblyomma americanum]